MNDQINKLKSEFKKIKNMGYIKCECNGLGGVGTTLEKLLKINTGNFEIPDFYDIELKTRTKNSTHAITLFSCVPDGPLMFENKRLKDCYGYPDKVLKKCKVLNGSVFGNKKNNIGFKYTFKLKVDRKTEKIYLEIYDIFDCKIEDNVFWHFDTLKTKLYRKLKTLALINANKNNKNNNTYFKYYKMKIYSLKNFNIFLNLIENGIISVSFKLSVYRKGKNIGELYDHGTSFNIHENDLDKLFTLLEII